MYDVYIRFSDVVSFPELIIDVLWTSNNSNLLYEKKKRGTIFCFVLFSFCSTLSIHSAHSYKYGFVVFPNKSLFEEVFEAGWSFQSGTACRLYFSSRVEIVARCPFTKNKCTSTIAGRGFNSEDINSAAAIVSSHETPVPHLSWPECLPRPHSTPPESPAQQFDVEYQKFLVHLRKKLFPCRTKQ